MQPLSILLYTLSILIFASRETSLLIEQVSTVCIAFRGTLQNYDYFPYIPKILDHNFMQTGHLILKCYIEHDIGPLLTTWRYSDLIAN